MSCCGSEREKLRAEASPIPATPRLPAWFEYVGATGMTVIGGATRRVYRFNRPGARVPVDWRDRASLLAVPKLRLVAGP